MEAKANCDWTRLSTRWRLRVVGLMSGTSADGVDVAIVDIAGRRVDVLAFETFPYKLALRQSIFELFSAATARVDRICHLNFVLGEVFAQAVITLARRHRIPMSSIDLIGSHGQTIHHLPRGLVGAAVQPTLASTFQIGEPSVIAQRTGITTVADFRPRDIAAGGQGAPLVPLADLVLFGHRTKARAVQNIGGIANVTFLPPGAEVDDVLAFDTGPGNMIIDGVTALATRGRQTFDRGGLLAARGQVHTGLLAKLMRHPYLRRKPPKTTGREEFGLEFSRRLFADANRMKLAPKDIIATATAFTADSIADAYARLLPSGVDEAIICGGGAWNETLLAMLRKQLAPARVVRMDEVGISADAKEAVSFAILAYETIHCRPGNVPSATGARRPVVLGKIVPGGRP